MKISLRRTISLLLVFFMVITCCITSDVTAVQAAAKKPTKIVLNTKNTTASIGDKVKLKVASVKPAKASKQVTWSTSNKKLATVSKKGVVKAKKAGTVIITAKSTVNKKVKAKCKIKIYKATKTIQLVGSSSYTLKMGEEITLNAKVTSPAKGYEPIKWSSADSSIASVDKNGKVTAKAVGTTTVTAKSGKKSVQASIQVIENQTAEIGNIGVVDTNYGQAQGVKGSLHKDVTLFKGVPYAAPPVGNLRWAPPEDPEKWSGVRTFDKYAAAAMQWAGDMAADPWKTDFYYEGLPEFSENCLYLNIATPAVKGDEGLPVYVWFHGGGLDHGYSYELECDPEALAKKGVVVVEVGTRLGVFGYMALPQLDEASGYGASGNYGLMDSIKAVNWVKDNIKAFGGNPDNITLGGQSGGTSKTAAFFASEKGAGLAKNVIWESGLKYNMSFQSLENVEKTSIAWLKSCGLTGDETLEELRALPASVLMGKEENYKSCPRSMVKDNEYIVYQNLQEAYEAGMFEGVNMLIGRNLGESTQDGISGSKPETAEAFYAYYKNMLGDLYDEYDFENLVKVTDETAFDTARELTSIGFHPSASTGNQVSYTLFGEYYDQLNESGKVYAYLFSHKTPGRNEDYYWAWHSSELWYAFGSLRDVSGQRDWQAWDYELSDIMTSYWTNFMRTGNPNGEGLAEWLPADSNQLAYMNLGEKDTLGTVKISDFGKLGELEVAYNRRAMNFPAKVLSQYEITSEDVQFIANIFKQINEGNDPGLKETDYYDIELKLARLGADLGNGELALWVGEILQGGHVDGMTEAEAVELAIAWWERAAELGQPRGWTNIGLLYDHRSVPGGGKNFGNIPEDTDKAVEYIQKADEAGDSKAPRYLALIFEKTEDYTNALAYYEKAAGLGDTTGTYYAGKYYLEGLGTEVDYGKAMEYLIVPASNAKVVPGVADARYLVGYIYENGLGVEENKDTAIEWYKKASEAGSKDATEALERLGETAAENALSTQSAVVEDISNNSRNASNTADLQPVPAKIAPNQILSQYGITSEDVQFIANIFKQINEGNDPGLKETDYYDIELKLAKLGADLGNGELALWVGEIHQGGHISGLTEAESVDRAITWWERASKLGQPRGWTNIGLLCDHRSVPGGGKNFGDISKDTQKALEYIQKADEAGDTKAPRYLALIFESTEEYVNALSYYEKAAGLGDVTARYYAGKYYLEGIGTEADYAKAIEYLLAAASNEKVVPGVADARYYMGYIYENGLGTEKNTDTAIEWYEKAAANGSKDAEEALNRLKE